MTHCVDHAVRELLPRDSRFFLTGFSFGGMVSGHLSTLMPERIRRIVLVGAGGLKATRKPTAKLHKLLPTMAPQVLADEARRNLELLMLHDPDKVDGVAIYMQILNTTRAKTRSRDMGIAGALSNVLPRVKTPLAGIWGEFDSTTYPYIQERIDLVARRPAGVPDAHHPGRRPLGRLRGRRRVQRQTDRGPDMKTDVTEIADRISPLDPRAADRARTASPSTSS